MRAVTHVPFGVLVSGLSLSTAAVFFPEAGDPTTLDLAVAGAASLLPDIDHPRSLIGRMFPPLSRWIEFRWGHRTVTHSWVFMALAFIFLFPLRIALGPRAYMAAWFGILSHIALDMTNVEGVPFFWPLRRYYVTPPSERMRIRVGSAAEYVVAAVLYGVVAIATPVSQEGLRSSFYRNLTQDLFGAARESRRWFPENELTARIRGTWRDRLRPTDYDTTFTVVAVAGDALYLGQDEAVFATGGMSPAFTIDRILVERSKPIIRTSSQITLDYQLLDEVGDVPPSSVISGSLSVLPLTEDQRYIPRKSSEEFETIKFIPIGHDHELVEIVYCPARRFLHLYDRGIFAISGALTISTSKEKSGGVLR